MILLLLSQGALLQGRLAGARHWQLGVNLWAMPALVAPFVWHSWAAMGWANANFLFAAGLVQMAGAGILLSEVLAPGRVERPGEDI